MKRFIATAFLIIIACSCSNDEKNEVISDETNSAKTDSSSNISYLEKNNNAVSKSSTLNGFTEEDIKSYINADLKLAVDESANYSFYEADILGNDDKEVVCTAQLLNLAEKKHGKFDHKNDKLFGLTGPYHKVYIVNKENLKVEKIEIGASAVYPLEVSFLNIKKDKKAIQFNYRIRESGFVFIYGEMNGKFKQIFAMDQFNLRKYKDNKLMVNHIEIDKSNSTKGIFNINICDAEISNYDYSLIEENVYEFNPVIRKKSGVKRTFFYDTISKKYAVHI